ncbi:MAG TPA: PstS family phosphate ABC transporter substrate-binding protein [Polyangiaceae bacterium]|nr:PstS family phosphate ABC transporter substrate-binding protein [Polyangiaceae bacterium]
MNSMRQQLLVTLPLIGAALAWGCAQERSPESVSQPLTPATPATLAGQIRIDGSSTVLPVSRAMAKAFGDANPGVKVDVQVSGTSGGFEKLCAGQIDIAGASRPINAAETERCKAGKVDYIELPIAFDSLSVVVSQQNTFADCLKVSELKTLWEPAAEGKVTQWSQVREGLPAQPVALFGPDQASGTYDYFTLAIVGTEGSSRKDYSASADDEAIESGVAKDPNALGFFGYSYYLAHKDQLKSVAVDNGKGCVQPSPETVNDGSYQPLSRPIFIYVNRSSAARPELKAFVRYFLSPENTQIIQHIGYVPLPAAGQRAELARFDSGTAGTVMGGHGSVIGVRADRFGMDEDRLKSALVQ